MGRKSDLDILVAPIGGFWTDSDLFRTVRYVDIKVHCCPVCFEKDLSGNVPSLPAKAVDIFLIIPFKARIDLFTIGKDDLVSLPEPSCRNSD